MALDPIWKQQLTLVTYGNEFLSQDLSFNQWVNHAIFNQHRLYFRDLLNQHLLAQHFQIWLEGLKRQGVYRLSLHSSSLLNDEKNPNANVELLATPHFIISHHKQQHTAWILGKELAEWYTADNDYEVPTAQHNSTRQETFWRFELSTKYNKPIEQDLAQPNWDDIQVYTDNELFNSKYAQGFIEPSTVTLPYLGLSKAQSAQENTNNLALFPSAYSADYAHETLHRLEALSTFIQNKMQYSSNDLEQEMSPEERMNLRHFSQKLDNLYSKFITKVANHYQSARLTPKQAPSPFEATGTENKQQRFSQNSESKVGKSGVMTLIVMTILICIAAYYFGL
ncbi:MULTISPECIES: hypothetical protein [unclassified Acinetobacter]|uniref:hypothetical protein n=1 Tax=unclassified Acinetobacter TaxID=196816 RepID=UPI002574CD82|nr:MULTISPECIES: hypothetical protein [unclassified Acinetobacter]MDM1756976.1 hypothetical protein [Acinetobacter sp. 256-1]MDM1759811.1 hypothetical protein [Acinetobacter sp. 251-1]